MMNRLLTTILLATLTMGAWAQNLEKEQLIAAPATAASTFDIERRLDSLDQELLPKKVTGGVLVGGNFSDFIIREKNARPVNSYMRAGLEFGGFLDFTVTRHFSIMGQAMITVEQNRFQVDTVFNERMWNFGIEIPVYFVGRFGNTEKGWIQFGAGPYTHFTIASNIGSKWENGSEYEPTPEEIERKELENKYEDLYKLHGNHFGVAFMLGYEFPFGMQIFASYKISLSDIATFYSNYRGSSLASASLYPQRISLNIGYRIQRKTYYDNLAKQRKLRRERQAAAL